MKSSQFDEDNVAQAGKDEIMAALFTNMVSQLSNTALIFLGQIPHPETGETVVDLESAKMFIDQLEMLEFKAKGNLSDDESRVVRQATEVTKNAFVEALNAQVDEDAGFAPIQKPSAG